METFVKIHSPFNYRSRRCGSVVDVVLVDVVDTSVDNVKDNISTSSQSSSKSYYTNSDVPTPLFGPGILATPYDPSRHRGSFAPKQSVADAAAGAVSNPVASNSASNAAATSAMQSNSATVNNS